MNDRSIIFESQYLIQFVLLCLPMLEFLLLIRVLP